MSLRFRRFLYIGFILIFLIITPLISLYTTGYKISSGFHVQKTGILIIDSEPDQADIYLNNKIQRNFLKTIFTQGKSNITTPAKIKNLLPGEYDVRLERENYWPWQKKLKIKSGQSTFAEDIYLFKHDLPLRLEPGQFSHIGFSPNRSWALLINRQAATLLNLENNKKKIFALGATTSLEFNKATTTSLWSVNSQAVIINNWLFKTNDWLKPQPLNKLFNQSISNLSWHSSDDNILYAQTTDALYSYEINSKNKQKILTSQALDDYLIKNNNLYYLTVQNGSTQLNSRQLNSKELIGQLNLPCSKYTFINPGRPLLNLYDENYHILYLIDFFSDIKPLRDTISSVKQAVWIDNSRLLYTDGFEIWLYDTEHYKKDLLTRVSNEITTIFWHPSNNYVIFTTDQSAINIIELDDREKRNITEIIKLEQIKWPCLSKDGQTLYFYAKIGSQAGLYQLAIQ